MLHIAVIFNIMTKDEFLKSIGSTIKKLRAEKKNDSNSIGKYLSI